jgi:hypothetical protein
MLIKRHDKSYIVELEDDSTWRIWPGDLTTTLKWMPSTQLSVVQIEDEFCTHALVDQADGTRARVIAAKDHWWPETVAERIEDTLKPDETASPSACLPEDSRGNLTALNTRRFPTPWSVRELEQAFVVQDANGQVVAYIYFRSDENEARQDRLLTHDEARRLAANIAELPELVSSARSPVE